MALTSSSSSSILDCRKAPATPSNTTCRNSMASKGGRCSGTWMQIRLGLSEAGQRPLELRLERPLVDHVEQLALIHVGAVDEGLPLEQARHLAADFDGVRRLGLTDIFVVDRHRLRLDLDDR